jgi:hypothetical protein
MKEILISIMVMILLFSCNSDRETTITSQEAKIDSYISSKFADSTIVRNNGSNRIVLERNIAADSLVFGDSLHYYYAGYVFSSSPSSLFATNVESVAQHYSFNLTDSDFSVKKILFTENSMISGLVSGFQNVREGEHCIILFSAKYGFYNSKVYNIPKLSALAYEVWVDKVIKNSAK